MIGVLAGGPSSYLQCATTMQKSLHKKHWLRRFLIDHRLPVFRVFYVFLEAGTNPAESAPSFELPLLRIKNDSGSTPLFPSGELGSRLSEFAAGAVGVQCVQVAEVVPAETLCFSTVTSNNNVLIEVYPGGVDGAKDALMEPTVYTVDSTGTITSSQEREFTRRAKLGLVRGQDLCPGSDARDHGAQL